MQVSEIMHRGIISVNTNDSIKKVAALMKEEDIGSLPVLENDRPVGFVTDRDIVITCVALGTSMDGPISQVMTEDVICVSEEEDVEEASRLMRHNQISRLMVVDQDERPVGMLSLQDLSINGEDEDLNSQTLAGIKE